MASVTLTIDDEHLINLMRMAEVAASHNTVSWETDRSSGLLDNWDWFACEPGPEKDRVHFNLRDLLEAVYEGLPKDDRLRLFHDMWGFRKLKRWMGLE